MVFKQLLQAEAIDVCQIDSCRLAGVSEVLSVLLMAAKCVPWGYYNDPFINSLSPGSASPSVPMRAVLVSVITLFTSGMIPIHLKAFSIFTNISCPSLIDYIAVSGSMERNVLEFVDHLHEHFLYPCSINKNGRYNVPSQSEEGYRCVPFVL